MRKHKKPFPHGKGFFRRRKSASPRRNCFPTSRRSRRRRNSRTEHSTEHTKQTKHGTEVPCFIVATNSFVRWSRELEAGAGVAADGRSRGNDDRGGGGGSRGDHAARRNNATGRGATGTATSSNGKAQRHGHSQNNTHLHLLFSLSQLGKLPHQGLVKNFRNSAPIHPGVPQNTSHKIPNATLFRSTKRQHPVTRLYLTGLRYLL